MKKQGLHIRREVISEYRTDMGNLNYSSMWKEIWYRVYDGDEHLVGFTCPQKAADYLDATESKKGKLWNSKLK